MTFGRENEFERDPPAVTQKVPVTQQSPTGSESLSHGPTGSDLKVPGPSETAQRDREWDQVTFLTELSDLRALLREALEIRIQ